MNDRGFDDWGWGDETDERVRTRTLRPADRVAERAYFTQPLGTGLPVLDGEPSLVFASDNYLGLACDGRVQKAARQAAETVGTGSGGARLATGDTLVHHDLERLLAETKGTERALVFPSGYAAAVGTITALEPDVVFSDEYNHQGILDGCRLSGAEVVTYDHCDAASLEAALDRRAADDEDGTERWLVVTASVFGQDGTVAPLATLSELTTAFGAWIMVDESHAAGLYAHAGGVVQATGLDDEVDIQIGTLSAAFASQGGYVAGAADLIEHLVTRAHLFGYAAGLAPPAAAAASEAVHVARHGDCRDRLWANVEHLRDGLHGLGYEVNGESQILAIQLAHPQRVSALVTALRDRGVVVGTVTPADRSACGIRVTPIASHDQDDIVACLEAFEAAGIEGGVL